MNEKQKQPSTLADLRPHERNPRTITAEALDGLKESVGAFGDISGIVWNTKLGCLVTGHQRVEALKNRHGDALQIERDKAGGVIRCPDGEFRVRFVEWDQDKTDAALLVANNQAIQGDWTDGVVAMLERMKTETGEMFEGLKLDQLLADLSKSTETPSDSEEARRTLAERFGVPPFSVLDARQGYWQDRKRAWLALGIKSDLGRGGQSSTSARAKPGQDPSYREIGQKGGKRVDSSPGGAPRPACDYSKQQRGNGQGKPIA